RLELKLNNNTTLTADKVLLSVGRKPVNNLTWKGININEEKGAIVINDFMQTSCDKIYAIGDVTGKMQLAHTASKQGLMAAQHIASRLYPEKYFAPQEPLNYNNIPRCIFTHPEIASVGYTQKDAEEIFGDVIVGKFPFAANGKAVAMGNINGFVKTIARKDTSELVGMHIMGPNAAELIAQGTIMIVNKNKAEDIDSFVFAHPTLSEAIMEAMEDLQSKSIHKI
ncbi:MAG: FAD-dependent oxidoreductase, partial [Candidatus Cloacimonetes bacterium]|nr:FAD-dependent oxidoreductase [Candidatus Cloacimonadota bacterium]